MPVYAYKGVNQSGKPTKGTISAEGPRAEGPRAEGARRRRVPTVRAPKARAERGAGGGGRAP